MCRKRIAKKMPHEWVLESARHSTLLVYAAEEMISELAFIDKKNKNKKEKIFFSRSSSSFRRSDCLYSGLQDACCSNGLLIPDDAGRP
jgi:hypothetical protein